MLVQTSEGTLFKFLWATLDVAAIATPSLIFEAFLKETMQFVLGKNFSNSYITMEGNANADAGEAGVAFEL